MTDVLLIGTGRMARTYAPVLRALEVHAVAVGRSEEGVRAFAEETGMEAHAGGFARWSRTHSPPSHAIIAVDADKLAPIALATLKWGVRSILLEKPAGLTRGEILTLKRAAARYKAKVWVAYNRRYYGAVREAKRLIDEDDGATSYYFEFNERLTQKEAIHRLGIPRAVEDHWFIANSTHVVDLAFYLGGTPHKLEGFCASGPLWAPHPTFFAGSGITKTLAPFAYQSNWELAGPWRVEVATRSRKLVLDPVETLRIEENGKERTFAGDELDARFKPGIYAQVQSFLAGKSELPTLEEHSEQFHWYEQMVGTRI